VEPPAEFVPLLDDQGCARHGWPQPPDRARRLRILCDGYGLLFEDRAGISEVVAECMEATASGIERLATEGVAAHTRLVQKACRISCGPRGHGSNATPAILTRPSSMGCRVPGSCHASQILRRGFDEAGGDAPWPICEVRFLGLAHLGEYGPSWDEGPLAERERVDDPGVGGRDGLLHLHRLQDEE
jgi:hypothetical protein